MDRRTRGQEAIYQQLDAMEAAGLGGAGATDAAKARLEYRRTYVDKRWREPWRAVIGVVLLACGVGSWFVGHLFPIPAIPSGEFSASSVERFSHAYDIHLYFEMVGVLAGFSGLFWIGNQIWPRRRTYARGAPRRAWLMAALIVGVVVMCFPFRQDRDLLGYVAVAGGIVSLQATSIVRLTGPDRSREPVNDPRGDVIRALTPYPVMVGLSVAFIVWQLVQLGLR